MAFDGAFLSFIIHEISQCAIGARVDKIHQPSREEVVISLRWKGGAEKLFLSAAANSPRVHFTSAKFENPASPPMFCMLLRKHLSSAKLVEIKQINLDRMVHFVFESINEMGDLVNITLAVEIMGRHSNIILIDQNNRIIDSIKRIDEQMSGVRQVLPGMQFTLPPAQDKFNIVTSEPSEILQKVLNGRDIPLSKALSEQLMGIAPLVTREISHYVTHSNDEVISELSQDRIDKLLFALTNFKKRLSDFDGTPTMLCDKKGTPKDFSFIDIHQYGHTYITKTFESYSELLDSFYSERDAAERMKQRSHDLLKLLVNTSDRLVRKIAAQKEELSASKNREQLKIYGDLLSANMYMLEKGMKSVEVVDFYSEDAKNVRIELDPLLTPSQNIQRYYQEYRKADTAEKMLRQLIEQGEAEAEYIDSVFDQLTRIRREDELNAIREELAGQGYIKNYHYKNKKPAKLSPIKYISSDGFTILVGRNNIQNDRLTLKDSRNYDIWFHTQKIPGSHTVVVSDSKEVPNSTLEEAAIIAAYNSRARNSSQVPVDYTLIKNIKKPVGAKPGMVIYNTYQTAYVTPDEELVNRLLAK